MNAHSHDQPRKWIRAWPDALAFAGGLAVAWFADWQTTELVWSLWLSSLVVGYATIVWSIFRPAIFIGTKAWGDRAMLAGMPVLPAALGSAVFLFGGLLLLAFFSVHFGFFHFVHSVFLQVFFPVTTGDGEIRPAQLNVYLEVARRYWIFLPVAFLAERHAFRFEPAPAEAPDTSVTAKAIAARKARNAAALFGGSGIMAPYKNVVRLHLLIFFFAAAHFLKLESFLVYAVVYAAYFFPWRLAAGRTRE